MPGRPGSRLCRLAVAPGPRGLGEQCLSWAPRGGGGGPRGALGGLGEDPCPPVNDAIAAQLLRDQYLLTALELHTELLERGHELPWLRDYFSNLGNFERQSGIPLGTGAPGVPGSTGLGGAGGWEPSTTLG